MIVLSESSNKYEIKRSRSLIWVSSQDLPKSLLSTTLICDFLLLMVSSLDVLFIWIAHRAIYIDSAAHTSINEQRE